MTITQNDRLYVSLAEATRGDLIECEYYGAFAVVDSNGKLLFSQGSIKHPIFMRSSTKPLQALPFVENGGMEHFGLNNEELSVLCASHSGTDRHFEVVRSIQQKIGVQESDLLCGVHNPLDKKTHKAMLLRGEKATLNRHQCSGKHTGMLAYCQLKNLPIEDYIDPEHPLQKQILKTCCEMWEMPAEEIHLGIDGCSAPVFALPLFQAAHSIAKLCDPIMLSEKRADACRKITKAMITFPEMVAGPGQFDTVFMRAAKGKAISKTGADGYQIIGVMPGILSPDSPGFGIALKISDGDASFRARPLACLEILRQMGGFEEAFFEEVSDFDRRPLRNHRKFEIGELRPTFDI